MGIPVAPAGLADQPLANGPFDYATGEGQNIRVTVLTKALSYPFTLTFLPDGTLLITQRDGKLRVMRNGKLEPNAVAGGPASFSTGTSGLPGAVHGYMDIALHPQFAQNQTLYLSYTKPLGDNRTTFAVTRAKWTGTALSELKDVFVAEPGDGGPTPIAFGRDGMLYIATSGGDAQSPNSLGGKVLRVRDDGSVPNDNPFVGKQGYRPEIYTLGHRNSLGLARASRHRRNLAERERPERRRRAQRDPCRQELRLAARELRPHLSRPVAGEAADARRLRAAGRVLDAGDRGLGLHVLHRRQARRCGRATCSSAACARARSRAPASSTASCSTRQMEELRRESLLVDLRQRVRDVQQGPDGLLYVITDEDEGAVLRIEPR